MAETKYKKLLGIGTGIIGGLGLYYLLRKSCNTKQRNLAKSIDEIVEDKLGLSDTFGEVTYIPREE